MARPPPPGTPQQCCRSRDPRRNAGAAARCALAAVGIATLAAVTPAHAARSCAEWSAEITTVEGIAEVLRSGGQVWTRLAIGDRVCTGDMISVQGASRVTVTLPDENKLRFDEHTTLVIPDPPSGRGSLIELLRGVIHVISRDPRLLLFTTPYANAGLEGTEFDIRVDDVARRMEVVVLEGRVVVTNSAGTIGVTRDQMAIVDEDRPPAAAPIPEPIELMRWASHYPSIIDYALPSADQAPSSSQEADPQFFAERAAARLATARLDAVQADIDTALRLDPDNVTALSVQALVALARADRDTARNLIARAQQAEPNAVVALLARSHVEERSGELASAEQSIRAALEVEPENAIALTRRAELALAQGDAPLAIASATRAHALAPARSAPVVVLGFASLRAFDTADAQRAFEDAVALEPSAPLPHLALGLVLIQRGDELEGRRQVELAVALDPANPLLRSYMAKIYDTENRAPLTVSQLDLAKGFDPVDPTASLYSALQNLRSNRPVEALQDLRGAAERNGDRPVFRSSLGLDEDVATSSAALSRVHTELGFGRLALLDAWDTLADDASDYAGHRLLAGGYSTEPRHEIARVSELLASQLMQPANVAPIKPQLAQPDLFISQHVSPSNASFDELDSPVLANGLKLRASAVRGGNDTAGQDVTLAGLHDRVSYSVGYYDFATDGFRDNNDVDQRVVSAFVQGRPSHATNLQAELRSVRTQNGDLALRFDPELYSPSVRFDEDADSIRLGAKQQLSRNDVLLGSLIAQDVGTSLHDGEAYDFRLEQQGYSADVQHIRTGSTVQIQSGIVYAWQDEDSVTHLALPGLPPVFEASGKSSQLGLYSYAHFNPTSTLTLTAGASFDEIDDTFVADDAFNPKLGVIWRPTSRTTLRAAAFETLFGSLTTSTQNPQPRLEPVQVAGFTQLLFGGRADHSTVSGLAIEHELSARAFVGWEGTERDTDRIAIQAFAQPGDPLIEITLSERVHQAYLYWTPTERVSFSTRYEHGRFHSEPSDFSGYSEMTTRRLPLEVRYFARGGLTLGARVTYVDQDGLFQTPAAPPGSPAVASGEDRFSVLDAFIGYRLANRRGLLSLNADNLGDEHFQFQDIDPTNPSIMPERLVSFRFTLAFD